MKVITGKLFKEMVLCGANTLHNNYPEIDALLTSSYQSGTDWTYNEFKFTTPSDWGEGTLVYLRIDHNGMSDGSEFIISVKDVQIEYGNKEKRHQMDGQCCTYGGNCHRTGEYSAGHDTASNH